MGDRQIWYHIREGFRSIFTHGLMSIAAVCMTVACLLIMGSFSLIAINANHVLGDLEDDNQFLAYIDDSLTRAQAQALESQIKAVPNVADIHFVTKEEALANFKANQERQDLFDNVESDTLRDRYEIHVVDIQLMQETVDQVKDIDGIAKVQASLEIADGFVMLRNVATALAIILVVMLVLISISIIANTIKITVFNRRKEIGIMKLVGATNGFIRFPFFVEGVTSGLISALIASAIVCGGYYAVYEWYGKNPTNLTTMFGGTLLPLQDLWYYVVLGFMLFGFVLCGIGTATSIRKHLQV